MPLTLLDVVGHLSFGFTALSFLMRDMILLRGLAIVSGVLGVAYNYYAFDEPWLVIFWLTVFLLINVVRVVMLILERRSVSFSEEQRELYQTIFRQFAPVEFMKIMRLARWQDCAEGAILAEQGAVLDELKLIYNGEVAVERGGRQVARSRDGTLIGEISYVSQGAATATVRAVRPTRYLAWPVDDLRRLLKRNPTMDIAMGTVFHADLARKLEAHSADD